MMPIAGTDLSNLLLQIESVLLGFYLLYALASVWSLKDDRALLLPSTPLPAFILMGGVMVLSGALLFRWQMEHALLAVELPLGMALALFHPSLGLGLFIVLLFFRPWELMAQPDMVLSMLPRLVGILALLSAVYHSLLRRDLKAAWGWGAVLTLLFAGWVLISTYVAPDPSGAMSAYIDGFLKAVLIFFISINSLHSERSVRVAQGSLVCAGLGVGAVAIIKTVLSAPEPGIRLSSFGALADPNDISAVMMIVAPFVVFQAFRAKESVLSRLIAIVAIIVTCVLLYLAKSRGALLSALVMAATALLLQVRSKTVALVGALLVLSIFAPVTASFDRSDTDLSESSDSRMEYWKTAGRMALHNPVFGVGYGGYPIRYESYASKFIETGKRTAHSSWFLVLGETGPIGLFLFASLYICALIHSWSLRLIRPEYLVAIVGYGTAMTFLSHCYTIYPFLLCALVFSASRISRTVNA